MPFDPPLAEPARTRRSSRREATESTPSASIEEVSPAAPADVPEVPLSRRALRDRQRAAAANVRDDSTDAAAGRDAGADAFVAASRAFASVPAVPPVRDASQARQPAQRIPDVAQRARRPRRRFVAIGATVGVMGMAGLIAVSMTLPAGAVAAAQGAQTQSSMSLVAAPQGTSSAVEDEEIQAYVASSDVHNDAIQRSGGFSSASLIDLATQQGISYSNDVFTNDPDADIQWPFIVGVSMSYGYGMRDGRLHEGLDLLPGAGAPVQAIADGKVRIATESGGNYGVTVYIDHMVDGKLITSHYSHMQYSSLQVEVGQTVKVGDIVGKVGNTGRSYGAHMHFELIVDGSTIDPLPWLNENAGRYDGVSPVS